MYYLGLTFFFFFFFFNDTATTEIYTLSLHDALPIRPLVDAGTPTRVSVTSRTYMEAVRLWAGCSGTVAECHLQPQGLLGRSTFKGNSNSANHPLTSRGIAALVAHIESRAAGGPGSGIVLLDS